MGHVHLPPSRVVEVGTLATSHVAGMEPPAVIQILNDAPLTANRHRRQRQQPHYSRSLY